MKKAVLLLMVTLALHAETIRVAAAANLIYAFDALEAAFLKMHPDAQIRVTFGSSGKLMEQIRHGAPFDLFLAANMRYPEALLRDGAAVTKPVVYAQGTLAILSVKPRDFSKGIGIVGDAGIRRIAIPNPKTAPYGTATEAALNNAGVYAAVRPKLVYAESVSQAVAFAVTAADVGFIAKSALYSPKLAHFAQGKHWIEIDPKLYQPIAQGMVLLTQAKDNVFGRSFYDFILSEQAKSIFRRYGYLAP